jgi:hypothetical protein
MIHDQEQDWMLLYDVVDHVAGTQNCYRERAVKLVQDALDSLKVKSRTVDRPQALVRSFIRGSEIFHEPPGEVIEVWREDVLRLWPDVTDAQSAPPATQKSSERPKSLGPKMKGVLSAIRTLWPDGIPAGLTATDRNNKIMSFLEERELSRPNSMEALDKLVQRLRDPHPELWREGSPGQGTS